nr:hypothetical protein [Candidatus Paceibacterota bacterium]
MAKLSLDLSQFKAAGVYTVEVDQSERITVTTQSLRLVVGFSKIGPFNAPTFIRSTRDRARFFGDIDKKLEKKGSFFQRSIDTCLLQAPVFALNLLNLASISNPDASGAVAAEYTGFASLSLDASASNPGVFSDAFINFYNRERFWKPDPDYLLGVAGNKEGPGSAESTSLLQVANVGTKRVSVIVRKAVGLQGYDVTAKDWYGSGDNIPYEWIRPYDQMKNYFIQVIAIEGDWTNYTNLSSDPFFSAYFNTKGIIPSKLNDFINLPQVSLVGSWIGTFIPDFRDQTGANQNIEDIVNASVSLTGILINVNQDALDQLIWDKDQNQWEMGDGSSTKAASHIVDLVGHGLIDAVGDVSTSFLSYQIDISTSVFHNTLPITLFETGTATGKEFYLNNVADAAKISIGTLLKKDLALADNGIPGVTYVTSKIFRTDVSTITSPNGVYVLQSAEAINGGLAATNAITQMPIDDPSVATCYKFLKLDGLKLTSNHLPGYTITGQPNAEEGVIKIYEMLEDEGILRGLTNPEMIN